MLLLVPEGLTCCAGTDQGNSRKTTANIRDALGIDKADMWEIITIESLRDTVKPYVNEGTWLAGHAAADREVSGSLQTDYFVPDSRRLPAHAFLKPLCANIASVRIYRPTGNRNPDKTKCC